jgi:phosphoribosylglycinamide formyltransferase-1
VAALRDAGAEWIVLAGFMRVLTPAFLQAFPGRVINIHPALLPAFPGVNAQRQALEYGVKISGCTVHFVDEGVDTGPIIAQRAVPVEAGDDEHSLSERIHRAEHELLVEVLGAISSGAVVPRAPRSDARA